MILKRRRQSPNPFRLEVKKQGFKNQYFVDIYQLVLASSWLEFCIVVTTLYICLNSFFAFLYFVVPGSILNTDPSSYWDAFVFSFQTSTTIGYGYYLPATTYAEAVVILDTLCGIVFVAITTGLAFAKFSRPTAKVLFTSSSVIHLYEGKKTLFFRVANASESHISEASLEAAIVMTEESQEGVNMQRIRDLTLVRSKTPMFFMSWTVMHVIDETSPMYNMTAEQLRERNVRIVISLSGIDDWSAQLVHSNHLYKFDEIIFNKRFVDVLSENEDGSITMDYQKFHQLEEFVH